MKKLFNYFINLFHAHKWEMLSSQGSDVYLCIKCKKLKR